MFKATSIVTSVLSALAIAGATMPLDPSLAAAQTAKKLKCTGCVKSKQIKNNSITSKDIKKGQVKSSDLGNNAVTGAKIKDGTVGESDLSFDPATQAELDAAFDDPPPPLERVVFVTSTVHDGNFGGIAGADAICNARATEAGLPGAGNYLAWLSNDALDTGDRFVRSSVPYVRTDGVVVATDWADLTDGELLAPIRRDEKGRDPGEVNEFAWTATGSTGTFSTPSCLDWTSRADPEGGLGGSFDDSSTGLILWTDEGGFSCTAHLHIYCFQQ